MNKETLKLKENENQNLQVFVRMVDFYSNPYVVVIIAEEETKANELFEMAQKAGFRTYDDLEIIHHGALDAGTLFSLSTDKAGVYIFEAPGSRIFK